MDQRHSMAPVFESPQNRWFFTAQEGASGHKEGQAAQAVLLPGLWSPQPCQEMGASRVLTMQIAGESLLNAPRHGHVCVKQKDPFPKSSWPLRTGRRSSVWLVFYNLMKGEGGGRRVECTWAHDSGLEDRIR